jgi:hypothetical protein
LQSICKEIFKIIFTKTKQKIYFLTIISLKKCEIQKYIKWLVEVAEQEHQAVAKARAVAVQVLVTE